MGEKFVHYGDYMMIFAEDIGGYLMSPGFTDETVSVQEAEDLDIIDNVRGMLFQVLPKLSYDNAQELAKFHQKLESSKAHSMRGRSQLDKDETERLESLQQRKEAEAEINERVIEQRSEETMLYGHEIQLRHVPSQMMLRARAENADGDRSCSKLDLTEAGGIGCYFKVESKFKYRREGDRVALGDFVHLRSIRLNLYLHVTETPMDQSRYSSFRPSTTTAKSGSAHKVPDLYEANLSSMPKPWKFVSHSFNRSDTAHALKGGSIVRLYHTEKEGYLASEGLDFTKDGTDDVFLRHSINDEDFESSCCGDLFIIEIVGDFPKGSPCTWTTNGSSMMFRLRHLVTSRLMIVVEDKGVPVASLAPLLHEVGPSRMKAVSENAIMTLEPTAVDNDEVMRDSEIVKIKLKKSLYLTTSTELWYSRQNSPQGESVSYEAMVDEISRLSDNPHYSPIENDELAVNRFKLTLRTNAAEEDAFCLKIAKAADIKEIEMILSTKPIIASFVMMFKRGVEPDRAQYARVEEVLSRLILFTTESDVKDPFICEGIPYKVRQKYLRELGIIDLLCDVLYFPFVLALHVVATLKRREPLTRVCQLSYRLIKLSARDYTANEIYCAQWIAMYMEHCSVANEENDLKAESTLVELIDNNKMLLEIHIKPRMVEKFINLCIDNERHERYVRLISSLCTSDGEAIVVHQNTICDLMVSEVRAFEALMMRIGSREGALEIEVAEYKRWISLTNFEDFSAANDNSRLYRYFLTLLELVAELAFDRNHKTDILKTVYSFDISYACASSPELSEEVRARFVRIILHLHVNQGDVQKLTVPNYTRLWRDIESRSDISCSRAPLAPALQEIKKFVYEFLMATEGTLRAFEGQKNSLVKEVLLLVQFMISHGFYTTRSEISTILDPLVCLLDGTCDITMHEDMRRQSDVPSQGVMKRRNSILPIKTDPSGRQRQRYSVREDTLVMMECKKIICQTLIIFLDIKIDTRISRFLVDFKGESTPPPTEAPVKQRSKRVSTTYEFPTSPKRKLTDQVSRRKRTFDLFSGIAGPGAADPEGDQTVKDAFTWLNEILQDEELELSWVSEKDFIAVMLDLLMYKHYDLVNDVFQLILKNFSQRIALIQSLGNLQIIESEAEVETMQTSKANLRQLKEHVENAEFWLGLVDVEIPGKLKMLGVQPSLASATLQRVAEIMTHLIGICSRSIPVTPVELNDTEPEIEEADAWAEESHSSKSLKRIQDISVLNEPHKELFHFIEEQAKSGSFSGSEPQVFSPGERPDREAQRLLRNLNAHLVVLELLKYRDQGKHYSRDRHNTILRYCYAFLAKFCRGDPVNQALLFPELGTFIEDLSFNVFSLSLIKEIFRDNDQLIGRVPVRLFKQIIKVLEVTAMCAKKTEILSSLKVFMKSKGRVIKNNQIEIMNALSRGDKDSVLQAYILPEDLVKVERTVNSLVKNYLMTPVAGLIDIVVPDELSYLTTLLEVMAVTAEDKISVTERICQSVIPLPHFIRLLNAASIYWPLKRSLVLFFLHVFLDIEFVLQEDEEMFLQVLNVMCQDLGYIIDNYTREGSSYRTSSTKICYKLYNGSAMLVDFALHYVYRIVIPCITEILERKGTNFPVEGNVQLIEALISYACQLHRLTDRPDYKHSAGQLVELVGRIDTMARFVEGRELSIVPSAAKKPNKSAGLTRNFDELINASSLKNSRESDLNELVQKLQDREVVQQAINLEFEELVASFMNIPKITSAAFGPEFTLESSDVVSALIKLTDPAQTPLNSSGIVMSLRILRKIIEIENRADTTPCVEWEYDDWSKFQGVIVTRQHFLASLDCVKLLCDLMVSRKDRAIRAEVILCTIAMLLGGNKRVQGKFLEYFNDDRNSDFLSVVKDQLLFFFEKVRKRFTQEIQEIEDIKAKNPSQGQNAKDAEHYDTLGDEEGDDVEEDKLEKYHRSVEYSANLLRFIQLLCEGHNRDMQNVLREQRVDGVVSSKSFDFVYAIGGILGSYTKFLHFKNLQLGYQVIDTLTELVQGPCRENQRILSQGKIIDHGRDLLACLKSRSEIDLRGFDAETSSEDIGELKSKTVNFLLSLLEGDADLDILARISLSLDFKRIKERMYEVFARFISDVLQLDPAQVSLSEINNALRRDSFEGAIEEGFNLYVLLSKITDDYPPAKGHVKDTSFTLEQHLAFNFFKMHTGRIEVVVEGLLQRTYFPILPICKHISDPSKKDLMLSVDRESPSNKIIDMLSRATDLIDEMNHNEKLGRTKLQVTPEKVGLLRDMAMVIVLFINYLMLFYYNYQTGDDTKLNIPSTVTSLVIASGIAQLALNCLVLVGWCIIRGELVVKRGWRVKLDEQAGGGEVENIADEEVKDSFTAAEGRAILLAKGPKAEEFYINGKRDFGYLAVAVVYYYYSALTLLRDNTFRYYCVVIIFSVLGLNFPIAYSILLLDVVYRFPTLRNVLASVVTNANQLLMTAMLGIIIIYIYAFWGFSIDTDMYFDAAIGDYGESQCQSLWNCFLTTLNLGLRSGGGISDILIKIPYENLSKYYQMFIFSLSFFLVVIIILLNIIFGIIIDTFAQLRDQKNFIEEDMRTKCFICNIDRYTFDRNSYGFEQHIVEDHNVWQYLYFLVHLQEKDHTEYNGTESFCDKMIAAEDISWIPLHRALCLKNTDVKLEEAPMNLEMKAKVDEIDKQVKELVRFMKALKD
jgi:hypothetical protein